MLKQNNILVIVSAISGTGRFSLAPSVVSSGCTLQKEVWTRVTDAFVSKLTAKRTKDGNAIGNIITVINVLFAADDQQSRAALLYFAFP